MLKLPATPTEPDPKVSLELNVVRGSLTSVAMLTPPVSENVTSAEELKQAPLVAVADDDEMPGAQVNTVDPLLVAVHSTTMPGVVG